MISAVLDTSVLWPSLQRDFLLSLAIEGLYRPLWSEAILEELHLHETQKLVTRGTAPADAGEAANWLIDQMHTAFDDAIVTGWEALDGTYGLPDPNDEHVVAADVVGGAGVIVTDNLRHFPATTVPAHIDVQNAREFATSAVSVDPERATRALTTIARRHRNPKHTTSELLDLLEIRYRMSEVAAELLYGP